MSQSSDCFILAEPAPGLTISAEADGVWIRGSRKVDPSDANATRIGRLLEATSCQLLESALASQIDSHLRISYENFVDLPKYEIDTFECITPAAPFVLSIESSGWLGGSNFKYKYQFHSGARPIYPRRIGCFIEHDDRTYQLDSSTFALLQSIDEFNHAESDGKKGRNAFISFRKIKGLASEIGTELDRFVAREKVLIANRIGLELVTEPDGRISFAPKVDGAPEESLRQAFFASADAEEMYSLDEGDGTRIRVILDEEQREVLRRMQRVRHLGGLERARVLRNPEAVFDGVGNHVDLRLDQFGPRVKGIGDFPFVVQPYVRFTGENLFDAADPTDVHSLATRSAEAGLQCRYADGSTVKIVFESPEDAANFRQVAREAWSLGRGVIERDGKSIALDEQLIKGLDEQATELESTSSISGVDRPPRRYLLIQTNEEAVDYVEEQAVDHVQPETAHGPSFVQCELPQALRPDQHLKEHQKEGLAWLQGCFKAVGRRGCLLADDMGLGKTLQVLSFLAWLIERGELSPDIANKDRPPWDPILVVMPLVLLENEVWQKDMRQFFAVDGAIFQPWLVLRNRELNRLRRDKDQSGGETVTGQSLLDVTQLRDYRLIFTNYETITNYQFSFARRDLNWSVVVTDEAQAYKTPNTKISHALKALTPRFRVACTGTPVETRLSDVWNIFDFLQPGELLASVNDFTRDFERPYQEAAQASDAAATLKLLRSKFKIGERDTWIMRRDKRQRLPDLPSKEEHALSAPLSDEQRQMHLEIMKSAGNSNVHPFKLLHELMDVYQHPALRPRYEGISPSEALARCPKLGSVIAQLTEIKRRGEKVLIFAHRKPMQLLLKTVIDERFGLAADIINGDRAASGTAKSTRSEMLERFRVHSGFNATHSFARGRWPRSDSHRGESRYSLRSLVEPSTGGAGN